MVVEESRFASEGRPSAAQILRNARLIVGTHAFRLAALYFLVFAASVLGVLLFVYLTSADFVERQTEATLDAEITGLAEQYAQRGLSGLVQIVAARSAGDRGDAMLYLVTDPDGRPLAGNIAAWPVGVPTRTSWLSFALERTDQRPTARFIPRAAACSSSPAAIDCWSAATSATRRRSEARSERPCCGPGWSRSASV